MKYMFSHIEYFNKVFFKYHFDRKEDKAEFFALCDAERLDDDQRWDYYAYWQSVQKERAGKGLSEILKNNKKVFIGDLIWLIEFLSRNYPKGEYRAEAYLLEKLHICYAFYSPANSGICFSNKRTLSTDEARIKSHTNIDCQHLNRPEWLEQFSLPSIYRLEVSGDMTSQQVVCLSAEGSIDEEQHAGRNDIISLSVGPPAETIGRKAFYNCGELIKAVIGESVSVIGDEAFAKCSKLETVLISPPLRAIGDLSFFWCRNMLEIELPDSLESIGRNCFQECRLLEKVAIPPKVTDIKDSMFKGCVQLREVVLPKSLSTISRRAFSGCIKLEKIILPKDTKSIGIRAFEKCCSLTSVELNDWLEEMQPFAFASCDLIPKIVIPKTIKVIEEGVFNNCLSLKEVVLPETIKRIKRGAFTFCFSLEKVIVPKTTVVEDNAFLSDTEIVRV